MESASIPSIEPKTAGPGQDGASATSGARAERDILRELGELVVFSFEALRALPRSTRYLSEALRLNAVITRRTTLLLFAMTGFIGVAAANFGFFFLRSIGASDFTGVVPGVLDTRQIAPQMFAYVFAGSVCCGIAAELGAARIQQEIAAYEAEGVDPMAILIGTRVIAVLMYVPLATFVSIFGCFAGGFAIVVGLYHGNTAAQYLTEFFSVVPMRGLLFCMLTIGAVALQCVLVSCYYGMRVTGGPDAVGGAVARSLAVNLVLLHVVVTAGAIFFYGGSIGLPIGG
ncbi:MAG: MlaE family ABC transporter permease [Solirubrobacteraceae bacterium]